MDRPARFGSAKNHDDSKKICSAGSIGRSGADIDACLVVSVGSANQWEFEEAVFDTSPCKIMTFDCTSQDTMPDRIRSRTTFYKVCVDQADKSEDGKRFMSWKSMMKYAGIYSSPTVLK